MTVRACPACDGRDAQLIHRLDLETPDGHPLARGYDVVSCHQCGTGFADVALCEDYYDGYYADRAKYALEAATRAGINAADAAEPSWILDRFELAADQIGALLPDREARILDIGCANGTLLAALSRRGYRHLQGVDPSLQSSAVAAATHGIPVTVGTFSKLPADLGAFDGICLTGVLEHLWEVDSALTSVLGLLRPGGIVYLSVPDASRYLDPYIAPFQDFSTEHVNHFSPVTLAVLADRFGLQTLWSGPADADLGPRSPCAAVSVGWQCESERRGAAAISRDEALVASLTDFTARSIDDFAVIDQILEAQLAGTDRFAIWGFGEFTMKLLACPSLRRRRLVALIDANPTRHGITVRGVAVCSPEGLPAASTPLVIGSLLSEDSIMSELVRRRLTNPTVCLAAALRP